MSCDLFQEPWGLTLNNDYFWTLTRSMNIDGWVLGSRYCAARLRERGAN